MYRRTVNILRRQPAMLKWILPLCLFANAGLACSAAELHYGHAGAVYPTASWQSKNPAEVGMDKAKLDALRNYVGGRGCVARDGLLVYTWGDASKRKDVASAVKPVYTHFLLKAIEQGKLKSIDELVCKVDPRLNSPNRKLGFKDRKITWRHLCNQVSCYGVQEQPGRAFDYSDYNMALFFDTLLLKVYGSTWKTVDRDVLHPELTSLLQCQDKPTFMAFGTGNRPGRLAISPRDFARFGLLYLRNGKWKGKQLISARHASLAVTSPLPTSIPRTKGKPAEMIRGQRSIGGGNNQCDHNGSYSFAWWVNGVDRDGKRNWPGVPDDVFGCFGHGDIRAMVVMPSLDLIVSWNDTKIRGNKMVNYALKLLMEAAASNPKELGGKRSKKGGAKSDAKDFGNRTGVMWKYMEWSVENVSYSGNPFDVLGTVTFSHSGSDEGPRFAGTQKRTTEMFYDGDKTWKFRFTGTRTGNWTFITSSSAAQLNGRRGTVTVKPNPNPNIKGFLKAYGNKFALQVGNEGELEAYRFNAYMNGRRFPRWESLSDFADTRMIQAYLENAKKHGFDTIFVHVNNNWFKLGAISYADHNSKNPDPRTFEILEKVITTAHGQGCRVHIWAWGDEARKWTPIGVGGKNGIPDKRLQRYIAARLGPLPGWTMGYGFDLQEWTTENDLREWARYTHRHMGWRHLLWGRGRHNGELDAKSYSNYQVRTYEEICKDLNSDTKRPHLYEERHTYLRNADLDMDGTRRFLWKLTMAGGMGCFWGFYPRSTYPYPDPEQLHCAGKFWKGRFLPVCVPDNSLTDGYGLKTPERKHYVFYKEDASSIRMNLSGMAGVQPAIAVDTKKTYHEIELGMLAGKDQIWDAPYRSDWAIAVGDFGGSNRALKPLKDAVKESGPRTGQLIVDPQHPQWLKRKGGRPLFMCGPGDPEDFLYRGKHNPDGTRTGDQMTLINKLKGTGANCIYLMAVRSHGGDGDRTHNPFKNNNPSEGISPKVLDQWVTWFTEMDNNGIVIFFFFYDDSARIWNTGDSVGSAEKRFIHALVNRFEHHKNLIWCIAEEYQEAFSPQRVRTIAAEIRAADDHDHVIAVHKLNGLDFSEFADDPGIDQFAIQYNVEKADALHRGTVTAWRRATGKYNLNLAEAANYGSAATARKKSWAIAMGGAYVMVLGMDIAGTPISDLKDCGRLVRFFESTSFYEMSPHDELKYAGTEYVLARPGDSYIAYASDLKGKIGLRNMTAGDYTLRWFDCATGKSVTQQKRVGAGNQTWPTPPGIGPELALYLRRTGD